MSLTAAMIDALVASGATAEMLAAVMKASLAEQDDKLAQKRANDAKRQRAHRERNAVSRDVTVTGCDKRDDTPPPLSSPPLSPQTPNNPPPIIPPTPVILRGADAFDQFWSAYPRRTGKEAARKAWAVVAKRGVTPDRIMAGLHRFAEHPPDDPQFIPHPATWLNQGRYDDEPMEARNGNGMGRDQRTGAGAAYRRQPGWERFKRLQAELAAGGDPFRDADEGAGGCLDAVGYSVVMPERH